MVAQTPHLALPTSPNTNRRGGSPAPFLYDTKQTRRSQKRRRPQGRKRRGAHGHIEDGSDDGGELGTARRRARHDVAGQIYRKMLLI